MTDPSEYLIRVRNSFTNVEPDPNEIVKLLPKPFSYSPREITLEFEPKMLLANDTPVKYYSEKEYETLQALRDRTGEQLKATRDPALQKRVRAATNPFEGIGWSFLMDRAGVKLANCDAFYNFTVASNGLAFAQDNSMFTFCDIAGGPGAFTQYLQYRQVRSAGIGITINSTDDSLNWKSKFLDMSRMHFYHGANRSGDLFEHWNGFIDETRNRFPEGVHFAVADGGYEPANPRYQESELSSLILVEVTVAIQVIMMGGNFVLKIFDSVRKITADLIFILSNLFEKISIFKPISSRPGNAERYLIAQGFTGLDPISGEYHPYITLLNYYCQFYCDERARRTGEERILLRYESLLKGELPGDFLSWLQENNRLSIERQMTIARKMEAVFSRSTAKTEQPRYDLNRALIIWNLPGNYNRDLDSAAEPFYCEGFVETGEGGIPTEPPVTATFAGPCLEEIGPGL